MIEQYVSFIFITELWPLNDVELSFMLSILRWTLIANTQVFALRYRIWSELIFGNAVRTFTKQIRPSSHVTLAPIETVVSKARDLYQFNPKQQ